MKIYVASSWRNEEQQSVVLALRSAGHEVYDFKNPSETDKGFAWSDIDPNWKDWTNEQYIQALQHPIAEKGFKNDFDAMHWADACVMVMPCGRSAHVEAGWMQGANKPTIVLQPKEAEPELMYKMFYRVCTTLEAVVDEMTILERRLKAEKPKFANGTPVMLKDNLLGIVLNSWVWTFMGDRQFLYRVIVDAKDCQYRIFNKNIDQTKDTHLFKEDLYTLWNDTEQLSVIEIFEDNLSLFDKDAMEPKPDDED